MYTANTMSSAAEVLGMTLPGSSSFPATSPEKLEECDAVGPTMFNLLELNLTPRDIMTRTAFENAMVLTMVLGGSTNAVLHLIAIAHSVGVELGIDDFQAVSDRVPYLADLRPSGKYSMEDVYKLGGIPSAFRLPLHRCPSVSDEHSRVMYRGTPLPNEEQNDRRKHSDCHRPYPRRKP